MFSREEAKKLRSDFWISFGKSYPKKWLLYRTGIKGLALKFHFDKARALVALDIETDDFETRLNLWERLLSLKGILTQDYLPEANFEDSFLLANGKEISRIYLEKTGLSIHDKGTWQEAMGFMFQNMQKMEDFLIEYRDGLTF